MSHIAVELETSCSQCGAVARASHVVSYHPHLGGHAHYSESVTCSGCGAESVADGGEIPAVVREALLRKHGGWRVDLVEVGERRPELARHLAQLLGLSRAEALERMNALPATLLRATLPEAEQSADEIRRLGGVVAIAGDAPAS